MDEPYKGRKPNSVLPNRNLRKSTVKQRPRRKWIIEQRPPRDCPISHTSILHRVPPEVRKIIFNNIIDDYFEQFPEHKELGYLTSSNRSKTAKRVGIYQSKFEQALWSDKQLLMEFAQTRIDRSIIEVLSRDVYSVRLGAHLTWPNIQTIKPHIRESVSAVLYEFFMCAGRAKSLSVHIEEKMIEKGVRRTGAMYIGPDDDEEYRHDLLGYLEHREALKQVERFSLVINQLLVQPKANKSTTDTALSTVSPSDIDNPRGTTLATMHPATTIVPNKLYIPKLQTFVLRFQYGRGLRYFWNDTAKHFFECRMKLFTYLSKIFVEAEITTFEYQELDAPKEDIDEDGIMSSESASFMIDLNAIFGVEGEASTEDYDPAFPPLERKVTVVWEADEGDRLVWNKDAEEELKQIMEKGEADYREGWKGW